MIYGTATYQTDRLDIIKSPSTMTFEEGTYIKRSVRPKEPNCSTERMDVNKVFNFVETDSVWVNMFKAQSGQVVDTDNFQAEVSTGKMENGSSELVTTIVEGQGLSIGRALGTENIIIAYKRSDRNPK
jgi:hypothetical protein